MKTAANINYQDEEYRENGRDSGAYRLWLAVTFSALKALRKSNGKDERARSFLFDENNPFVEAVFDKLGIDPDVMRKWVREKVASYEELTACI